MLLEMGWLMQWSAGKARGILSAMPMVIRRGLYGQYEAL